MTYKLLYIYETFRDTHKIRLYIYKKATDTEIVQTKYISALQGLRLEIQGGDNAPETAIVKTALHFSLEDCYDVADTYKTVTDQGGTHIYNVKHGNWSELYTPDSTLYKVVLNTDGVARWSGYLTPDAWEEELTYHSILNLTARDNLGHLEDIDFDLPDEREEGYFTLEEIVEGAMERVSLAMALDLDVADLKFEDKTGTLRPCSDVCFNVEGLRGKTWGAVLEGVLDSLGLCLRYVDDNTVKVCTLRKFSQDTEMSRTSKALAFANNSGHLSKSPSYRQIVDEWTPEGEGLILHINREATDYAAVDSTGLLWKCSSTSEWKPTGSLKVINPFALTMPTEGRNNYNPDPSSVLLLQAKNSTTTSQTANRITRTVPVSGKSMEVAFDITFGLLPIKTSSTYSNMVKSTVASAITTRLYFALSSKDYNGNTKYFDDTTGLWGTTFKMLSASGTYGQASGTQQRHGETAVTYSADMNIKDLKEVSVVLYGFYMSTSDSSISSDLANGNLYAAVTDCTLKQKDTNLPKRVVTTIYNENYNQQLKRSPEFGELNFSVVNANVVTNGLYYLNSDNALDTMNKWAYEWQPSRKYNLPVLIHQAIISYHARANNVLSGSILDLTADDPRVGNVYTYQGVNYLLMGGSINLFTGMVDNAVLKQFDSYAELWDVTYNVVVNSYTTKLATVKALSAATGMSFPEAKNALDGTLPLVVYKTFNSSVADNVAEALIESGAVAEVTTD